MKIVMVSTDYLPNIGGVAAHIYNLSKELAKLGNEVHIVNPRYNTKIKNSNKENLLVHNICVNSNLKKFRYFKYSFVVSNYIKRNIGKFDILHQHDYITSTLSCFLLSSGFPWVWTNHTSSFVEDVEKKNNLKLKFIRFIYNRTNAIICPSKEIVDLSKKLWPQKNVFYIPNGVDVEMFKPVGSTTKKILKNHIGLSEVDKIVFCPRRWVPKNGIIFLIKAIAILKKEKLISDNVKFIFAGNATNQEEYEKKIFRIIEKEKIGKNIILLGDITYDKMPIYNSIADIIVVPSLIEAISLSALEAMASGKPVVASNVGGLSQIFENGKTGFLVNAKDPPALAAAIDKLLLDPELRIKIGKNARKEVEEKYSWERIAIETLKVYKFILNGK